jgi:hypothetical protein
MGWKLWTRERLTAADLQEHIQDQVTIHAASASAFDTMVPPGSRVDGMRRYLADVKREEVYVNGVWQPIHAGDTGWQNLAIGAPVVVGADGAQYRVMGGWCAFAIHAVHNNGWAQNYPLTVFPVGARPSRKVWFDGMFYGGVDRRLECSIGTDGVFRPGRAVPADSPAMVISGSFPVG